MGVLSHDHASSGSFNLWITSLHASTQVGQIREVVTLHRPRPRTQTWARINNANTLNIASLFSRMRLTLRCSLKSTCEWNIVIGSLFFSPAKWNGILAQCNISTTFGEILVVYYVYDEELIFFFAEGNKCL